MPDKSPEPVEAWGALKAAMSVGMSRKSFWRLSKTYATQLGMTNQWVKEQGVMPIKDLWSEQALPGDGPVTSRNAPCGSHAGCCGSRGSKTPATRLANPLEGKRDTLNIRIKDLRLLQLIDIKLIKRVACSGYCAFRHSILVLMA